MRSFTAFRIGAQFCLAASALCLTSPCRENWLMFTVLTALAMLAGFCAARVKQAGLRLLLGLLPALALTQTNDRTCMLFGAGLTLYVAILFTLGRFNLDFRQYRRAAVTTISLGALIALFSLPEITFRMAKTSVSLYSVPTRFFVLACMLLTVLAIRAVRVGFKNSLRWELSNPAALAVPAVVGAGIGAILWVTRGFFRVVFEGIAALIGGLFGLLADLLNRIVSAANPDLDVEEMTTTPITTRSNLDVSAVSDAQRLDENNYLKLNFRWELIFVIAAGIAILVLVVWLLRRGERSTAAYAKEDFVFEKLRDESNRMQRRRRSRRKAKLENRSKIRLVYREYLSFLYGKGIHFDRSDTTEDVSEQAAPVVSGPDTRLREIYRLARYAEEEPDDQTVAEAEKILARLTAKPDENSEKNAEAQA